MSRSFTSHSGTHAHREWDSMPTVSSGRPRARRPYVLWALAAIGAVQVAQFIISLIS